MTANPDNRPNYLAARGKSAPRPRASNFSPDQGDRPEEYREYFEVWRRRAGGKGPLSSWSDFCHGLLGHRTEASAATRPSVAVLLLLVLAGPGLADEAPRLAPLPQLKAEPQATQVALGKLLFFDGRLSGDGSTSCADCHQPERGWADGLPLARGYPGSLYFRNTPTVLNAALGRYLYWDGRLPASDLPTLVRDHIAEAHFMQADGRLVVERLRQMPAYEESFREAFGSDPTYGGLLNALAAYLKTLRSQQVPFDRYLRGQAAAISPAAKRGLDLFRGKAQCIRCHHGARLTDDGFHNLGRETNPDVFRTPERHITLRRFLKTLGVSRYASLRLDPGRYALTKERDDLGAFRTPSLREVSRTAPYFHDGSIPSLGGVVEFYDGGGGALDGKDSALRPLNLTATQRADLVEFLKTLSGSPVTPGPVELPSWKLRALGRN